jgi:type IV secretory pathway VirD2 relaxase
MPPFAERCVDDPHNFEFIILPAAALEMTDLRAFIPNLMGQMVRDLGTKFDWTAVDHWKIEHPHVRSVAAFCDSAPT